MKAERPKDLPTPDTPNFLTRAREELMRLMGRIGDRLDAAVTWRDLSDVGLVDLPGGFGAGGKRPTLPGIPGSGGGSGAYEPDLTPPPTPTGLTATGGISTIIVQCDRPLYTQGHGHAHTVLYGRTVDRSKPNDPLPTFTDAVELATFLGTVTDYATQPGTTWRLWIKWKSVDGVLSADPAGGVNGLEVKTGEDVQLLLDVLEGQIRESQLFQDLGERIDLIDGTGPGSVNSRLQTKMEVRADENGNLLGGYQFKIDLDGYVTGFGLEASNGGATPSSRFAIRAGSFVVGPPAGTGLSPISFFTVVTVGETVNGVYVPPGIYAEAAFLKNGTITNAKIANLAVDDAKIANLNVSKLTAGSLLVGSYIQSASYIAGQQGFRINGAGNVEFQEGVFRGTIRADAGYFAGELRASTGFFSGEIRGASGYFNGALNAATGLFRGAVIGGAFTDGNYPANGQGGFYLDPNILRMGNANTGAFIELHGNGNVVAPQFTIISGNAKFAGNLEAASGTFRGSLTADAVNAVNTVNIAGNAITIPAYAAATNTLPSNGGNVGDITLFNYSSGGAIIQFTLCAISTGEGTNGSGDGGGGF